jgi:peptidoglycan/xylan/chitin deacetylase (PgdA/CDA1 family)
MVTKRGIGCVFALALLVLASNSQAMAGAPVLLFYGGEDDASVLDCAGVADALDEVGLPFATVDLDQLALTASMLVDRAAAVLCHLPLSVIERQALADWVHAGGGLLASGQSGLDLEAMLGVDSLALVSGNPYTEVRFGESHPVATGSWWEGPITQSPPMPLVEIPSIMRFLYIDNSWPGGWPAYAAVPAAGLPVARWRDSDSGWFLADGDAAVVVHTHGEGRVVYAGALPGVYANWEWPQTWRTFIVASLHWLGEQAPMFEVGLWPHGHRAALTWTGDTEKSAMVTAVPALLNIFAELDLDRFGTFYTVGQAGGDGDTLGAAEHPEIVEMIAAAGAQVGGHGNVHSSFNGQPLAVQQQRIQAMIDIIDPLLAPHGERVRGFRAPYLSQDWTTFQALAEVGLDYDAGEADVWSETTLPHRLGPVWQIPPSMPMDWHLFEQHGLSTAEAQLLFQDKLDYVISRRGLFSWLHHPWVIEPHLELVEGLLSAAVARGDIWMSRQDDLLDWWLARQAVQIGVILQSGHLTELRVDHAGEEALVGVSIWIRRPAGSSPDWRVFSGGLELSVMERPHADEDFLVIALPDLQPQSQLWLQIVAGDRVFGDRFEANSPP